MLFTASFEQRFSRNSSKITRKAHFLLFPKKKLECCQHLAFCLPARARRTTTKTNPQQAEGFSAVFPFFYSSCWIDFPSRFSPFPRYQLTCGRDQAILAAIFLQFSPHAPNLGRPTKDGIVRKRAFFSSSPSPPFALFFFPTNLHSKLEPSSLGLHSFLLADDDTNTQLFAKCYKLLCGDYANTKFP